VSGPSATTPADAAEAAADAADAADDARKSVGRRSRNAANPSFMSGWRRAAFMSWTERS
jgi:hypothetical protein